MDANTLTSRRAFLKSVPATALVAALPLPALGNEPASTVPAAIAAHRAAFLAVGRCHRVIDRIEQLPGRPVFPRVQVGSMISLSRDVDPSPMFATSHAEIERTAAMWCGPSSVSWPAQRARYRAQFDAKHRDLTRQIRARLRFDRASGLLDAQAALSAAYDAEAQVLAKLVLARPLTPAEGDAKRRYFKSNAAIFRWWEGAEIVALVRDMSCEAVCDG